MATWNSTELATQVLKELGVLGVGQTASAVDLKKVTDIYPSVYAQLRRMKVAPWTSSAIAEEAQLPLAKYLAGQVAAAFGFSGARLAEHKQTGMEGWIELQECAAAPKHAKPPKFLDY